MTNLKLNEFDHLFDRISRFAIGFDPLFRDFKMDLNPAYPPLNILKKDQNGFVLELAVAGFKKDEIHVEETEGLLIIRGEKKNEQKIDENIYHYHGIAGRSFTRQFRLEEHLKIESAKLEDGILSIELKKELPEIPTTKIISIK